MRNLDNNRIVFIIPCSDSHRTAEENLGIGYLTSILRKNGYDVTVVDAWLANLSPKSAADIVSALEKPLFLGFSCYYTNCKQAVAILKYIRKLWPEIQSIVGGYSPTFDPDFFLHKGFDMVFKGEAEQYIINVARYFKGELPVECLSNVAYLQEGRIINNFMTPGASSLDLLPYPSRDTTDIAIRRKTPIHILTSRGCYGECSFCSINAFNKTTGNSKWRERSLDDIVEELHSLYSQGIRHFKFIDDSFIEPPRDSSWCKEFLHRLRERDINGLRIRGSIRADRVSDDLMCVLKEIGFYSFSCGIENMSQTALSRMGKTASVDSNIKALDILKKYDMYVQAGLILFDPETSLEELEQNYAVLEKYPWIVCKGVFTEMYAAKGTKFTEGLLQADGINLGNSSYEIKDHQVRFCHQALKAWHTYHQELYDKLIDPLSAPKAISAQNMQAFFREYSKVRRQDLVFMKEVLSEARKTERIDPTKLASDRLQETKAFYNDIADNTDKLYKQAELIFDAKSNPFLKDSTYD